MPAESTMHPDGPPDRWFSNAPTSEESTRTPMYLSAGQRHPARSAKTRTPQVMRGLRRLQPAKRKACAART